MANSPVVEPISRRELVAGTLTTALLSGCVHPESQVSQADVEPTSPTSEDPLSPAEPAKGFLGDHPTLAHQKLRDAAPVAADTPVKKVGLVVVGGGMSGLAAAYLLRDLRPMVIEAAPQFGGNSRGEIWRDTAYALGAAYLVKPPADGALTERFFRPLGADRQWREVESDPVEVGGRIFGEFWEGSTDSDAARQFKRIREFCLDTLNQRYPEIPWEPGGALSAPEFNSLDSEAWLDVMQQGALEQSLHPHIATMLEHYAWSSFGARASEISAAAGLNFFTAEFGGICALPGGNAKIASLIFRKLRDELGETHMFTSAAVQRLELRADDVLITYNNSENRTITIAAEQVVVACPKFIARRIITNLSDDQRGAMQALQTRAYVVGNALLEGQINHDAYGTYLLRSGKVREASGLDPGEGTTDVILGHWAGGGEAQVLTLYRALPFAEGRARILDDRAVLEWRNQLREQAEWFLRVTESKQARVADMRVARFGHPMVVAAKGLISSGICQRAAASMGGRIHFCNQDNWALPAIETCLGEALRTEAAVRKQL